VTDKRDKNIEQQLYGNSYRRYGRTTYLSCFFVLVCGILSTIMATKDWSQNVPTLSRIKKDLRLQYWRIHKNIKT
jgi:hypothetical protein